MISLRSAALRGPLSLRLALRELRGGFRGFIVFLSCIALGTGTIAAVTSLAAGLTESILRESRAVAGGDVIIALTQRPATEQELSFLRREGRVSAVATLRAMLRFEGGVQLIELKAVDDAYPLVGAATLGSGRSLAEVLAAGGPTAPAVVHPSLLSATGLNVGDRASIGTLSVMVSDVLASEPDRLAGGIGFGPRVLIGTDALRSSGLLVPGSLVRWSYRIAGRHGPLSAAEAEALIARIKNAFPDAGWRIDAREDALPSLKKSIAQFAQYLTLVGWTALIVGGVGVANAVRAFILRRRRTIATLRMLGASRRFVAAVYLQQAVLIALVGIGIGVAIGAAAPPVAAKLLAGTFPIAALNAVYPAPLSLAALFGLLTALAFSLWPLAEAQAVPPVALVREGGAGRRPRRLVAAALGAGVLLVVLTAMVATDPWVAGGAVVGVGGVLLLLRGVAAGLMWCAARAPRARSAVVRIAIANLHRRGSLAPTVTTSLGLSLTLLATLALVETNLRDQLDARLPAVAPSFFFLDIASAERDAFVAAVQGVAPGGVIETEPMLRGRIAAINGTKAEDWPETEAAWVLRGDRGITYSASPPAGSKIVAGAWWPRKGPVDNEVSFAADLAQELGVSVGDILSVNVLGREIKAKITNLRTVDWGTLGINFVMVFSPNVFAGAPHAYLATLSVPGSSADKQELAIARFVGERFPTVVAIRVKDALQTVRGILGRLVVAMRVAASITLVAAMLVLAGTLAASQRERIYDAVMLKVLGARRWRVVAAYALEYSLLGLAAGMVAVAVAMLAAYVIVSELMKLDFVVSLASAVGTVAIGVGVAVGLGLIGTWRALGHKPTHVLREL